MIVIAGEDGLVLFRAKPGGTWGLPSGRIGTCEDPVSAAKRVARESCGLGISSLELAGIYDVIWHYSDVSIKRLHLVYAAQTEDECAPGSSESGHLARFFANASEAELESDLVRDAILDCSEK